MKKIFLTIIYLLFTNPIVSAETNLQNSEQMMVVTTSNWNAINGTLQRYERKTPKQHWQKVGSAIQVVIGEHGMAWGVEQRNKFNTHIKKEGDGRTPRGYYLIGPEFGFAKKPIGKLDYFPLTKTSECVDDPKSRYYNQLIDSANISKKDWNSSEKMHVVPGYRMGNMIQYNTHKPTAGGGSCIFMHIWTNSHTGTAGCIAMDAANLKMVSRWLSSRKNPMLVTTVKFAT